ncbi:MAG: hypothetical protein Q4E57_04250 [Eubacteriales bacterium]|nr:hypothetical protein [Eubacteriales bacterium]
MSNALEELMADVIERRVAEGKNEARFNEIYSSVRDGDYSIGRGAEKLGITAEELVRRFDEAGLQLPADKLKL